MRPPAAGVAGALTGLLLLGSASPALAAPGSVSTAGDGVVELALVVPIVVPLDDPPILGPELLEQYTSEGGLLDARLDAVEGHPVTLAIDPRILASIRMLGASAPEAAIAWLARLESVPHDSFLLGYADAELSGLAAVEALELGQVPELGFALDPDDFAVAPDAEPSPTPTPESSPAPSPGEPALPALPDNEALLAWPNGGPATVWTASDSVSDSAAEPLATAGVERVLVPNSALESASTPRARFGELEAIVVDSSLSARLAEVESAADSEAAGLQQSALLREIALRDSGAHPVVVGASRLVSTEPSFLGAAIDALAASPRVDLIGLDELGSMGETVEPSGASVGRTALLERIVDSLAAEPRVAAAVENPQAFLAERRLELLTALASGHLEPAGDGDAAAEAFLESSQIVAQGVQIVPGSDLLVLSNSAGLPVTVSNALDVPVTVVLTGQPLRPLLRITSGPIEFTVEPGSSHTAYLAAEAVTNGQVPVRLSLATASGASIGEERVVNVDLQAQWETIGLIVLIGLGVMFGAGIVRSVVLRRAATRARGERTEPDDADD